MISYWPNESFRRLLDQYRGEREAFEVFIPGIPVKLYYKEY
jgi:hypothetical protein